MAIREVREMGDDVLEKQCKPVTKMTLRTKILIEDMLDTMYEKEGEELLARAFCHEIDHLGGHLYVEKVEGELHDSPASNEEDMEYEVEE